MIKQNFSLNPQKYLSLWVNNWQIQQRSIEMVKHRKTGQTNFPVNLKLSCDFKDVRAHLLTNQKQDTPTMPTLCMYFLFSCSMSGL